MTPLQILEGAEVLLNQGWCQETFARDHAGNTTLHTSPYACSWCLTGAMLRASGSYLPTDDFEAAVTALVQVLEDINFSASISRFNDQAKSLEEVLDVVHKAKVYLQ